MPQPQGAELDRSGPAGRNCASATRAAGRAARHSVRGVHHLALICCDVEETIQFYQEFLGFPLVELVENRDYAGSSHFFFDIGDHNMLGFFDFPGHEHPAFRRPSAGSSTWPSPSRRSSSKPRRRSSTRPGGVPRPGSWHGGEHVLPRPERGEPRAVPGGPRRLRRRAAARLSWPGRGTGPPEAGSGTRGPQLPADHQAKPGPGLVDGADLVVHQAGGQGHLPDHVSVMSVGTLAARFGQAIHSPQAGAIRSRSRGNLASYSARDVTKYTITSYRAPGSSSSLTSVPGSSPSNGRNLRRRADQGDAVTGPDAQLHGERGAGVPAGRCRWP